MKKNAAKKKVQKGKGLGDIVTGVFNGVSGVAKVGANVVSAAGDVVKGAAGVVDN